MTSPDKKIIVAGVVAVAAVGAALAAGVWLGRRQHGPEPPGTIEKNTSDTTGTVAAARALPEAVPQSTAQPRVAGEPKLEDSERVRAMTLLGLLKQRANLAFQEGRYEEAIKGYQDCISITSALGCGDVEAVTAEQVIRSNVVMALIKLHQYNDARLVATMLLQDSESPLSGDLQVKVLYRRGMASKALADRDAALSDFNAAVQLSPGQSNPAAEKEIKALNRSA